MARLFGGAAIPVTVYADVNDPAHPPARADLWSAIFPPSTLVRGYKFIDLSKAPIRSYPIRELLDFLLKRSRFG